jgi:hypothetical protein
LNRAFGGETMSNSKDAYYFPHDSNAKDDPKIMILIDTLNLEGYGIFWVLIETLRDQKDYKCPLALVPVIAKRYNTTTEKVRQVICNYSLFVIENDQFFFSKSLISRLDNMNARKQRRIQASIKANETRWGKLSERSANGQLQLSERSANGDAIPSEAIPLNYTKLDYTKLNETKLDETKPLNSDICDMSIKELMDYFSFNEIANFDKFKAINQFANSLLFRNKIEYFYTQFTAYKEFKDKSGQVRHGFKSFLGTIDQNFLDGGWNAENWVEKLASISQPASTGTYDYDNAIEAARKLLKGE